MCRPAIFPITASGVPWPWPRSSTRASERTSWPAADRRRGRRVRPRPRACSWCWFDVTARGTSTDRTPRTAWRSLRCDGPEAGRASWPPAGRAQRWAAQSGRARSRTSPHGRRAAMPAIRRGHRPSLQHRKRRTQRRSWAAAAGRRSFGGPCCLPALVLALGRLTPTPKGTFAGASGIAGESDRDRFKAGLGNRLAAHGTVHWGFLPGPVGPLVR